MDVDNDLPLNQDRSHIVPRVLLEGMIAKIGLKHPPLNEEWLKAEKDYAAKLNQNRKVTEASIITVLQWFKRNALSTGIEYNNTIDMFLHILRIDSNEFSAHSGRNRALSDIYKYQPTINTSKALLYIMIDCVEWFEKVILNENINI